MSEFFCKKSSFFGKYSTFGQSYTENTKYYMPGVIQFAAMTKSVIFFDVVVFLLSSLVVGSGFMSISLLVLELWQISFLARDLEIDNTPSIY